MTTNHFALQLINLFKAYQEGMQNRQVLRDVNLQMADGEIVAVLGKSGSGKSTILNCLSGIDRIDAGRVLVEGVNLSQLNDQERTLFRRKKIGFIFQFFNLIPTLTVWENLILPLELNNLNGSANYQWAQELLELVGLADRKKTYPDRLSGGEQQRVAIARALVHDPNLLLADEPTGNLDEETGSQVLHLLERLTRKAGKGMILVTHSSEAAMIADRVFLLRDGRLYERAQSE